jgi:Transmembrane secretion effector
VHAVHNAEYFRMEMLVDSWSEHLRQHARITKLEKEAWEKAASYHLGEKPLRAKHFLSVDRDVFLLGQQARNGASLHG